MYSKQLLHWILESGEDDEIQLADIYYFVQEDEEPEEDLAERTIEVTVQLTKDGVIIPGDMVDYEFTPWTVDSDTAERRIREGAHHALREAGRFLPGDVCWFRTHNYEG
ncbi:hypothetical protein [Saccharopolyspora sp. 6M]|uniref:hypothetical protein n=1 Tax=Saccharopolyspora sp. 6M TaxID=2877237 RepID=UPI001CD391EE|nr:hypothetical protein [Saccharopolyspora sp. 6M]MCA1229403.1 hypothetical protein [Saccharopolyspora sp. 6M]